MYHNNVSFIFNSQDLSLVFRLCGMEVYQGPVYMFYANLFLSQDICELEALVLGTRIILNDFLIEIFLTLSSLGSSPYEWSIAE